MESQQVHIVNAVITATAGKIGRESDSPRVLLTSRITVLAAVHHGAYITWHGQVSAPRCRFLVPVSTGFARSKDSLTIRAPPRVVAVLSDN